MLIKQLCIDGVRNLEKLNLQLAPNVNVFIGLNGSGKTSLLESIYFLALGRSFRVANVDGIIGFDKTFAAVSAIYSDKSAQQIKISTIKHKNKDKLNKIGGAQAGLSQIALLAPTQIIHEGSSKLIFAEPEGRRKFLDWIVFYSNKDYQHLWRDFNRILQQRNSVLKKHHKETRGILKELDRMFVNLAEQIRMARQKTWQQFYAVWLKCFDKLGFNSCIKPEISLFDGWSGDLSEKLIQNYEADFRLSFTTAGPHRADLYFSIENRAAKAVLSRGQGKAISFSLILARSIFLQEQLDQNNTVSVLLIDDLCAELDNINGKKIIEFLLSFNQKQQVVITSIKKNNLLNMLPKESCQWFSMKRGKVNII
ncbi:MAG: DNA replication and repair protein RecF [Gammaproteobacteria bacterium]|jgi:DNA replication and repair protein RecF